MCKNCEECKYCECVNGTIIYYLTMWATSVSWLWIKEETNNGEWILKAVPNFLLCELICSSYLWKTFNGPTKINVMKLFVLQITPFCLTKQVHQHLHLFWHWRCERQSLFDAVSQLRIHASLREQNWGRITVTGRCINRFVRTTSTLLKPNELLLCSRNFNLSVEFFASPNIDNRLISWYSYLLQFFGYNKLEIMYLDGIQL